MASTRRPKKTASRRRPKRASVSVPMDDEDESGEGDASGNVTQTDDGGAIVTATSDKSAVTSTDDGGAIVQIESDSKIKTEDESDFYDNILADLSQADVSALEMELSQRIEFDLKAREDRDKQYEEGIRRTGLGDDAPGGAKFNGASKAVHPMMTKACIDFGSRTIKELMPKGDIVKSFIAGKSTKARVDKARRKAAYMNWQCVHQMKGLRHELSQGLTQSPLGGASYLRLTPDPVTNKPTPIIVFIDDVILPYAATSFYTAERVTYVEHITQAEYERRVKSGMYMDATYLIPSLNVDETKAAQASAKVEGKTPDPYNQDGLRDVYEVMVCADLNDSYEGKKLEISPYLVSLDKTSKKALRIVRNWEQDDKDKEAMFWMVELGFIPWRGPYPIGFTHIIGALSGAATGALRALLDSAHINNMPTLLKLRGAAFSGQNQSPSPTEMVEVTGGVATDDIRKLMMPIPFNPPSMVLFQLLGFLTEQGEGVVQVALDKLSENANAEMPVGTTLALIEQGMKVLSAIHSRLHYSFAQFLLILHRINRMYLTDDEVLDDTGELMVYRADFQGPLDVIPVSDPEIFTDVQRFAQMQLVAQRADLHPERYDPYKVERMILERTKIPDALELLVPQPEVTEMNAVNENIALALGRPVHAYPDQDHLAHIQVLVDFMSSPMLGQLPIIAPKFIPGALTHLTEHIVMWYASDMEQAATAAIQKQTDNKVQISDLLKYTDTDTRQEADKLLATISGQRAILQSKKTLAAIPAIVQRAQQLMKQFQQAAQSGIQDPKIVAANITAQVKREELQQEAQEAQDTNATKQQEIQAENQRTASSQQAEAASRQQQSQAVMTSSADEQQHEDARTAAENQTKIGVNTADNQTAIDIASAEIAAGKHSTVSTGTEVGKKDA